MDRPSPYIAATPTSPPHLYSNSELQQSLVSPPPPPPANSPPPRQHPASSPPRLRTSQSFRVDEGYSEETPVVEDIRRSHYFTTDKVTLPDWMTGLSDSLREEFAYKLVRTLPTSSIASLVERLTPILHLDFVSILPSELLLQIFGYLGPRSLLNASLTSKQWRRFALEPRLWRELYTTEGWEYDKEEIRNFEEEIRQRAEQELRAQMEARKAQEETNAKVKAAYIEEQKRVHGNSSVFPFGASGQNRNNTLPQSFWNTSGPVESEDGPSDMEGVAGSSTSPTSIAQQIRIGAQNFGNLSFASAGSASDEEEMYPSPHITAHNTIAQQMFEPTLPITPALTMPGYGHPKLNWLFLYKSRRRLEDNWLHNRFTTFQIPHPAYTHEGHRECIYTIQYSPHFLVSGSRDKTIRKWNIRTKRLVGPPLKGHAGSVLCLQFDESPDEDVIISGSSDSSVIIWRFSTGQIIKTIPRAHSESVLNLRFNKKYLVTCSKDKCIRVWNRQELQPQDPDYPYRSKYLFGQHRLRGNPTPARNVMDPGYSSDPYASKPLPNANPISAYSTIQLLMGHVAAVNAIQLHGDEIASASGDRVIKIWNLKTGLCEKTMLGHSKGIACIQYDGNTVVSGSSDHSIRVFDRASGADMHVLYGHSGLVRTVQASRDRIVSGSYDETVRVWVKRSAIKGFVEEGEEDSWTQAAILKQGPSSAQLTAHGMGIATRTNTMAQIQAAIANHNAAQQHHQNQQQQQQQQHHQPLQLQPIPANAMAAPANHVPPITQVQALHTLPQTQPQAQPPQQPQQHNHNHAGGNNNGGTAAVATTANCKVFKLQFDARWIICCCQDSKILGWDFANDESDVIEGSRFFRG